MRGQTSPSAKKNAISRAADSTESEPWVPFSVEAVSVVCAQGTRQRVRRVGCAQQVTMTLNRIFAFQHGNHDRAGSHEFNQTVKERATFVLSIEAASLLNGQMQHFGANNFEPCSFKARKDAANNVFLPPRLVLMMEKVRSIAMITSLYMLFCFADEQMRPINTARIIIII
ncbi:Uncharacterised protein [Klebsiella michiganensis]|uniref:Uncharacterized protein n=1 Tax=Klebsiella michiganensis TaxID=1134687 RepID=A0A7H4PNE3_9ENTR|nr:Uncharacterised protein [Klebsiella michiganensis]